MTIEETLQKAVEGGYGVGKLKVKISQNMKQIVFHDEQEKENIEWETPLAEILLKPSFWQSLGKAMGWKEGFIERCRGCVKELTRERKNNNGTCMECGYWDVDFEILWKKNWHRFIDHLSEGKDISSFFEQF